MLQQQRALFCMKQDMDKNMEDIMEAQQKKQLEKLISGYCSLKGIDKKTFVDDCKRKFGRGDSFASGVLGKIKADSETLKLVDTILELDSWQNIKILPANEVEKELAKYIPPFDAEVYKMAVENSEGNGK